MSLAENGKLYVVSVLVHEVVNEFYPDVMTLACSELSNWICCLQARHLFVDGKLPCSLTYDTYGRPKLKEVCVIFKK